MHLSTSFSKQVFKFLVSARNNHVCSLLARPLYFLFSLQFRALSAEAHSLKCVCNAVTLHNTALTATNEEKTHLT